MQELESWEFQFASTPKFKLGIPLSKSKLELAIEKGLIKSYKLEECETNESLSTGLDHLMGTKLRQPDLVDAFIKYGLNELDEDFKLIFSYLNKNIS